MSLYTDWLLNSSIAKNFDAFKRGFDLVMSQVPLADLFTAEEVELLVCGSNVSTPSVLVCVFGCPIGIRAYTLPLGVGY